MTEETFAAHPEVTLNTQVQIERCIRWTCARLGSSLADSITFAFNARMSSTLGKANCASRNLQFSKVLWPRATPRQRYANVVHEVCHLVAREKDPRRGYGHGWTWKCLMVKCGLSPHRCHTVPVEKRRQRGSLEVVCACPGKVHVLSTKKANLFRAGGANFTCRRCHTKVYVTLDTLKQDVFKHGISPMARMAAERSNREQRVYEAVKRVVPTV